MPRQPLFTDDQVAEALSSTGGIRSDAALLLKCSPSTTKRYIDRSEELARIESEVVERIIDIAESRLVDAINNGNLTAIMFYLKTKGKHRGYTDRPAPGGREGRRPRGGQGQARLLGHVARRYPVSAGGRTGLAPAWQRRGCEAIRRAAGHVGQIERDNTVHSD